VKEVGARSGNLGLVVENENGEAVGGLPVVDLIGLLSVGRIGIVGCQELRVLMILAVTWYGSALEAGRRSSR